MKIQNQLEKKSIKVKILSSSRNLIYTTGIKILIESPKTSLFINEVNEQEIVKVQ